MNTVTKNVRALAAERKMPLYQVEQLAGISKGSISHWRTNTPNVSTLYKVANALGVEAYTLLKE